jgi:hypothetical protein
LFGAIERRRVHRIGRDDMQQLRTALELLVVGLEEEPLSVS